MRPRLPALVLIASLASACGATAPPDREADRPRATAASSTSPSPLPTVAVKADEPEPAGVDAVSRGPYLPMWAHPTRGAEADFVFDARSPSGHGIAPMLIDGRRTVGGSTWIRVLLPIRPNGSSAWARADDVRLVPRHEEIVVDLSKRILWRYRANRVVDRVRVAIGAPATPTATGTFYVWQRVRFDDPNQAYGIFALGLSGFSPVLSDWPGGGRMAIHGTPFVSDRGRPVSHGCVRVYNVDMERLTDVRLGTPVIIRR